MPQLSHWKFSLYSANSANKTLLQKWGIWRAGAGESLEPRTWSSSWIAAWDPLQKKKKRSSRRMLSVALACTIHHRAKDWMQPRCLPRGWIGKQNMVFLCHRILLGLKKKAAAITCCDTNEPWGHKISQYPKDMWEVLRIVEIMETGSRKVFAGSLGGEEHCCLMGSKFQS